MARTDKRTGPDPAAQPIEELQRRYQELHTRKIQAETKRDSAELELAELRAEAREKFGTDDLAALRQKLQDLKDQNERQRAQYQADLDAIERELGAVEASFDDEGSADDAQDR